MRKPSEISLQLTSFAQGQFQHSYHFLASVTWQQVKRAFEIQEIIVPASHRFLQLSLNLHSVPHNAAIKNG